MSLWDAFGRRIDRASTLTPKPLLKPLTEPWRGHMEAVMLAGSRAICDPTPSGADTDYVCLVFDVGKTQRKLLDLGFHTVTSGDLYDRGITVMRLGDRQSRPETRLDLMLVRHALEFEAWAEATRLSKAMKLYHKPDRVDLHKAILNGVCNRFKMDKYITQEMGKADQENYTTTNREIAILAMWAIRGKYEGEFELTEFEDNKKTKHYGIVMAGVVPLYLPIDWKTLEIKHALLTPAYSQLKPHPTI